MVPLFSCENEHLRIRATVAAAETCDDSEIHMLVGAGGVISSILKYLKRSIKKSDFHYSTMELLGAIDKLACADTIKNKVCLFKI